MATDSLGRNGVELGLGGFPCGGVNDVLSVRRESRCTWRAAAIGDLMKLCTGGGLPSRGEEPSGQAGEQHESCCGSDEGRTSLALFDLGGGKAARGRRRRDGLQIECQIAGRLEALLGVLFETVMHDTVKRRRHGATIGWILGRIVV